jgi:NADPH2:quinone reductase
MAQAIGVRVIGTVGSESKVALATEAGAEAVLISSAGDVAAEPGNLGRRRCGQF